MKPTLNMASPFDHKFTKSAPSVVPTSPPHRFADIFHTYIQILESPYDQYSNPSSEHATLLQKIEESSSNSDLQTFLENTIQYENHPHYPWATGIILTKLIQNSHDSGFNSYKLNLTSIKPIDYLFAHLHEREGQSLQVMVYGTIGKYCCNHNQGGTYYLEKVGSDSFTRNNSTVYVRDAVLPCGYQTLGSFYSDNLQLMTSLKNSNWATAVWTTTSNFNLLWQKAEQIFNRVVL